MNDTNFINQVDHFIYVSQWQLQQFQKKYPIEYANNHVIRNAIEPIQFIPKHQTDKIKLIYTSMPNRGLEVLLDAFELLNDNNVELTVYSSNIIYGKEYSSMVGNQYDKLFHRCKTMKNVVYKGFAMNTAVRKALQQSHILTYPSIFPETSCLSAIEAGAAGCKIITTNFGALPETCDKWATYVDYTTDHVELVKKYTETLRLELDIYYHNNDMLQEQSNWFNEQYSWQTRISEWREFFKSL